MTAHGSIRGNEPLRKTAHRSIVGIFSLEAQIAELESLLATERATVQRLMGEKGTGLKTGTLAKPGGNRARIDLAAVAAVQEPEAEAVAGAKFS